MLYLHPTVFGGLTSCSKAESAQTIVVPCSRNCEPLQRYVSQKRQWMVFAAGWFDCIEFEIVCWASFLHNSFSNSF